MYDDDPSRTLSLLAERAAVCEGLVALAQATRAGEVRPMADVDTAAPADAGRLSDVDATRAREVLYARLGALDISLEPFRDAWERARDTLEPELREGAERLVAQAHVALNALIATERGERGPPVEARGLAGAATHGGAGAGARADAAVGGEPGGGTRGAGGDIARTGAGRGGEGGERPPATEPVVPRLAAVPANVRVVDASSRPRTGALRLGLPGAVRAYRHGRTTRPLTGPLLVDDEA